jgi:hypothetical protein
MRWHPCGVSPDATRHGTLGHGGAGRGSVGQSPARATDGGTEGFGLPCHPCEGGHGKPCSGHVRCGREGRGELRRGMGCGRQHWGPRLPLLLSTEGSFGKFEHGKLWLGLVGLGPARVASSGKEGPFGALSCCSG